MPKPLIAVSGSDGQLGSELRDLSASFTDRFDFIFLNRQSFDLLDPGSMAAFFASHQPAYFINCAAYTAVDKAETDQATAYRVNAEATGLIAQECHRYGTVLVHISTDYVFNGKATAPIKPQDPTDPVNYYGYSKLAGEQLALANHDKTIVIRTSWVYSSYGNNFVKTMLRLMKERPEINVVSDQFGSPTHAADLAAAIMSVIVSIEGGNAHYGVYHYSNQGVISWYDFAKAIAELSGSACQVNPIPTSSYPTPAKRPAYSVLDTSRLTTDYGIVIPDWKQSVKKVKIQK